MKKILDLGFVNAELKIKNVEWKRLRAKGFVN